MPAALPTDNALDKSVKDFGIGTYDAQADGSGEHGEDSEERPPRNLPDGGGPDVFSPDRLLSYPEEPDARLGSWWKGIFAAAGVPGDADRTVTHAHPDMSTFDDRVTSVSQGGPDEDDEAKTGLSELPSDSGNPSARSDYYDRTVTGATGDVWPKEDSWAYVSQEDCVADTVLPGVVKNEESMDNDLQSLGNWQSGYEVEDISGRQGFPATDFAENVDYDRSDLQDGGRVLASRGDGMNRKATNIRLVNDLTSEFLKEFGKKDLTKRHVLAFLQKKGEPQFLSSDVIRCLKLSHEIYVKDVLDEFPVARTASRTTIASVREKLIQLEIDNITDPEVSSVYRRCAANLARAMAEMERVENRNG